MTPRLRMACLSILSTCDRVLSAAWSRLNPTTDEFFERVTTMAETMSAPLDPQVQDADSLDDVLVEDGEIWVSDDAHAKCQQAHIAELTWRLNYRRMEYAQHGCQPYERDGENIDLVFVPGPKGSAS